MTMHLARGLSTLNTKQRKPKKLTVADRERLEVDWRQYNKDMRRKHMHSCQFDSFDDYVAFRQGTYKPKTTKTEFREWKPAPSNHRETPHIPSLNESGMGVCAKPERKVYTGTLIKGIATMHKSNAVPVINDEQAKDIAQMRRN